MNYNKNETVASLSLKHKIAGEVAELARLEAEAQTDRDHEYVTALSEKIEEMKDEYDYLVSEQAE